MANYSISDTTLTALGDAVRSKAGETRKEIQKNEMLLEKKISKTPNAISFTEYDGTGYGNKKQLYDVINIPGATSLKVEFVAQTESINYDWLQIAPGELNEATFPITATKYGSQESNGGEIIFENTDTVTFYFKSDASTDNFLGYYAEITPLGALGEDLTKEENEVMVKNTMTPMQMAEKINELKSVPEEAFNITGASSYKFAYGGWDWFINDYGSKITTSNITNATYMFHKTTVETIPFELNFDSKSIFHNLSYIFYDTGNLKEIPKINNAMPSDMSNFINYSPSIRYLPEDIGEWFDWSYMEKQTNGYATNKSNMFNSCFSLRKVPMSLLNRDNPNASYSYNYFYYGFSNCNSLDELVGLPIPYTAATWTSNGFYNTFNSCYRLKELTFALQEDGTPIKVNWKNQKIDLGANRNIGYMSSASYKRYVLDYNSGITADKEVIDDATYQALKDDPDWFVTTKPAYCRYNKQSAINTLNSLPDASEYLATAGGTNTIILPKGVGGSTDGGNTSDLTEEDIAVATAKGWTVSFY